MKYLVRSATNPRLVLCTNGEFMAEGMYGPGHNIGVKLFKYRKAAENVRNGQNIIVEPI